MVVFLTFSIKVLSSWLLCSIGGQSIEWNQTVSQRRREEDVDGMKVRQLHKAFLSPRFVILNLWTIWKTEPESFVDSAVDKKIQGGVDCN